MVEEVGESQAGTAPDWEAVQQDYADCHVTVADVCAKHGITTTQLHAKRRLGGWPMRYNTVTLGRAQLIKRMFALVDRHLLKLERSVEVASDKDVTLLGNLARTLDKLMELDSRRPKRSDAKSHGPRVAEMREALEARLHALDPE